MELMRLTTLEQKPSFFEFRVGGPQLVSTPLSDAAQRSSHQKVSEPAAMVIHSATRKRHCGAQKPEGVDQARLELAGLRQPEAKDGREDVVSGRDMAVPLTLVGFGTGESVGLLDLIAERLVGDVEGALKILISFAERVKGCAADPTTPKVIRGFGCAGCLSPLHGWYCNGYVATSPDIEKKLLTWQQIRNMGDGQHKTAAPAPNDLLFPSEVGTPSRVGNYLKRILKPIARKAGIPDLTF